MIRAILRFCINERLIVLLLALVVAAYGWFSMQQVPVDAIPNVGENQVIVYTPWPGRSPKDVEDQITYPLSVAMLQVPGRESVRGKSMFGYSFVQITFKENVDFYWARSRVAEQLSSASKQLPDGVTPTLGPDATALGQIFYYVLDAPPEMNLADQRSMQDFVIKYELQSVEGVSEVASIGGYQRQYQVEIDPDKLRFHNIPLDRIITAVQSSNIDVGAKTVESGGMEFIIRGKGFIGATQNETKTIKEIEDTVVQTRDGVPVRVRDVARVQTGPEFRRGALDLNGREAAGGVVVMRFGENPRRVIEQVRQKLAQLEPSLKPQPVAASDFFRPDERGVIETTLAVALQHFRKANSRDPESADEFFEQVVGHHDVQLPKLPAGYSYAYDVPQSSLAVQPPHVKVHAVYDRTQLIDETVATLTGALLLELVITAVVVVLFLLHIRTSIVIALSLPLAVLMAFIGMSALGIDANIMSLAGIAIAIGTMVDMGIIVSENIYRHLADWEAEGRPGGGEQRLKVINEAAAEVAPAVITAVTTTVVSFLPVFFLTGRDYKLFAPLAWTKTFAIVASLLVAVLLVPLLSRILLRSGRSSPWAGLAAGIGLGALSAGLVFFVWGDRLADWWFAAVPIVTALAGVLGFAVGYMLARERLRPIEQNPVAWLISKTYEPTLRFFLRWKGAFLLVPTLIIVIGLGAWFGLPTVLRPVERVAGWLGADLNELPGYVDMKHSFTGLKSDDWIALDEGSWFYMPTLYPAASFSQTMQVLQTQDAMIKQIPEVENVLGKIGRVESALDPAPAGMIETYVMLKPRSQWRDGATMRSIWDEINRIATLPGMTQASPLQPIEGRVVMLQSGIKAPMAIRIYGDSLDGLAIAANRVADHMRQNVPAVDGRTVNPDIVLGKPYLEFEIDREEAARYGMTTMMVNQFVEAALGGANVTTTLEGRERYPIRVRYSRELTEQIDQLSRLPVVTHTGQVVPLETLTKMKTTWGPGMISSENARLVAHVSFAPSGVVGDLETVDAATASLDLARRNGDLLLPAGYRLEPVGSFQNQIEANQRLLWLGPVLGLDPPPDTIETAGDAARLIAWWTPLGLVPLVIVINLFIIYLQFRRFPITLAVFSGIPVAFAGGMILLAIFQIEMNTAIWVGFIALFGIAVDDGVVIATYLNQVFTRRRLATVEDIRNATVEAGLKRIRPCLMTTFTTLAALLPVLMATGRGAEVARAMALPVFGGMLVELITLFVVPVVYCGYKEMIKEAGVYDSHWEAVGVPQPIGEREVIAHN